MIIQQLLKAKSLKLTAKPNGFSLVEAVLASSAFVMLVTALIGALIYGQETTISSGKRARAVFLAEEGLEAVRNIRDEDFSKLIDGSSYGLSFSGNRWVLVPNSPDVTDIYTRQITIKTVDDQTKEIRAKVDWQQNPRRIGSFSLSTYLTKWQSVETPTIGDWSNPFEEAALDLAGTQNGLKIQVEGNFAYLVRQWGNPDFVVVDISNPSDPRLTGKLNLPGSPRNIAVSGSYAYIASTHNSQELQIVDITNPSSPTQVGSYNAPGRANANGIFIQDSLVYLVRSSSRDDELLIIDAASPDSPSLTGSLNLRATANEIVVFDSKAYIASNRNNQELQIVDVAVPIAPKLAGSYNLPGRANAITVTGFSDVALCGRSNGDLYLLDVSAPSAPKELALFDAGDDVRDITLGNENRYLFIASDADNAEFQVVDISDLQAPKLLGSLDLGADLNGLAYHKDLDRVFAVGDSNSKEFIVISPTK